MYMQKKITTLSNKLPVCHEKLYDKKYILYINKDKLICPPPPTLRRGGIKKYVAMTTP